MVTVIKIDLVDHFGIYRIYLLRNGKKKTVYAVTNEVLRKLNIDDDLYPCEDNCPFSKNCATRNPICSMSEFKGLYPIYIQKITLCLENRAL